VIRYGKLYSSYWTSPDIASLGLESKAIGAYLLSSPHANMIGCYRLPMAYAIDDLKSSLETVLEGFRELSRIGFATYDNSHAWVLIRRFLAWNPIENPNQGKSAAKLVLEVPKNSSVYAPLIEVLKVNPTHLPEGFLNGLGNHSETLSKPVAVTVAVAETATESISSPSALAESDDSPGSDTNLGDRKQETEIVERLFDFYCESMGRDPRRYTLTKTRRDKALLRLRERRKVHGTLEAAEADLAQAIENLAASEYHRTNGYIDWLDQIFRSAEDFEKRLAWKRPAKGLNGNSTFESHNERTLRRTLAELDGSTPDAAGGYAPRPSTR
jgi:hypothetical protein